DHGQEGRLRRDSDVHDRDLLMRHRGFSLVDVVMVLIISGILVVFIAPILTLGVESYDRTSRNVEVLTKMRYAMERIAREIRSIRRDPLDPASYDIVTMTTTQFAFCRPDGTRVIIDNTPTTQVDLGYTVGFTS